MRLNSLLVRAILLAVGMSLAGDILLFLLYHQGAADAPMLWVGQLLLVPCVTVGVMVLVLRGSLRRPLHQFEQQLARVAGGDFAARVEGSYPEELAPLAGHFNAMAADLQQRQEELRLIQMQHLEHVDRLASVGEMAAGIAHEIRNPLAGISGAVSVLASGLAESDPRRPILREVLQQIDRLDQTVDNLLFYARPGIPEPGPCDLNELVKKTLFFVSQHPEARPIQRVEEYSRDLPPAFADAKQVQQVLLNLLLNAIQAMGASGTLRVITGVQRTGDGDRLQVQVCDTGPGIPVEAREKIFAPFFTTKARGTGLGLAICRRLAQQNGGNLRAEAAPGGGAMLVLELPALVATPIPKD